MRLSLKFFLLVAVIALSGCRTSSTPSAHASDSEASKLSVAEEQKMLQAERFKELDRDLSALQRQYDRGTITEEDLRDAFRAFYPTDKQLAPKFDSWVQRFPKSYVARLARAIYYQKVGEEARGDAYADRTTSEQFHNMDAAVEKAAEDLQISLTLDRKPILSFVREIEIARYLGAADGGRKFLVLAIALDPDTFLARAAYIYTLQTRWGGSLEEMQAFLQECGKARLSKTHLDLLASIVAEEHGWLHVHDDGDAAAAQLEFQRAKSLNPALCLVCDEKELSHLLISQRKYEDAIPILSDILARKATDSYSLCNRGYAYLQVGRAREAIADWTAAAEGGSALGQVQLGGLYMNGVPGVLARNTDIGIEWFRKAAAQGDPDGADNLKRALEFVAATTSPRPVNATGVVAPPAN
jgi:tetratricopeptide (TPR) repeat protein